MLQFIGVGYSNELIKCRLFAPTLLPSLWFVDAYKTIEERTVDSYKTIENGFVGAYKKIESSAVNFGNSLIEEYDRLKQKR